MVPPPRKHVTLINNGNPPNVPGRSPGCYPVWLVSYPLKDPATLVFRNAAGKQVAALHEPANP